MGTATNSRCVCLFVLMVSSTGNPAIGVTQQLQQFEMCVPLRPDSVIYRYLLHLRELVQAGVVEDYPPLADVKGSYVAQYEHTIILRSVAPV